MSTINLLTRTGKTSTPFRPGFILLSDVLGVSAAVDALNNPPIEDATENNILGPFSMCDTPCEPFKLRLRHIPPLLHLDLRLSYSITPTVPLEEPIASEGKGEYIYFEGRVPTSSSEPNLGAAVKA